MSNTKIVKEIIGIIHDLEYVSDNTVITNITFSTLSTYDAISDWTVHHFKEKYSLGKDYLLNIYYSKTKGGKINTDKQHKVSIVFKLLEDRYDTHTIQQILNTDYNIYMSENSVNKIKSEVVRLLASLLFHNS